MNKQKDKCRITKCRAESDITLPDGTGLCWECWDKYCKEKEEKFILAGSGR